MSLSDNEDFQAQDGYTEWRQIVDTMAGILPARPSTKFLSGDIVYECCDPHKLILYTIQSAEYNDNTWCYTVACLDELDTPTKQSYREDELKLFAKAPKEGTPMPSPPASPQCPPSPAWVPSSPVNAHDEQHLVSLSDDFQAQDGYTEWRQIVDTMAGHTTQHFIPIPNPQEGDMPYEHVHERAYPQGYPYSPTPASQSPMLQSPAYDAQRSHSTETLPSSPPVIMHQNELIEVIDLTDL